MINGDTEPKPNDIMNICRILLKCQNNLINSLFPLGGFDKDL